MTEEVLEPLPHLHYTFSIPKILRHYFKFKRKLLGKLMRCAWETVKTFHQEAVPDRKVAPGAVMVYQTYGNAGANFHPHIHALITEGCFDSDGFFYPVEGLEVQKMRTYFRHRVLHMLKKEGLLSDEMIEKLMTWRHCSGFNIHNKAKVTSVDDDGRERLARYLIRSPVALKRLIYDRERQRVVYQGKGGDVLYDPLDFLAQLTLHIPNPKEQTTRYYGFYSNKSRGLRKQRESPESIRIVEKEESLASRRRRRAWARLIAKVYLDDPLICTKCQGPMRVVAFIDRPDVVRKILEHLGMREKRERSPPSLPGPRRIEIADPDYDHASCFPQAHSSDSSD